MIRVLGRAIVAIVLNFVLWCPANAQPLPSRHPIGSVRSVNDLTIVVYVVEVELALAAIVAAACWLVLAIAGIYVSIEDRWHSQIGSPFLSQPLALQTVGKISVINSKAVND